jgi:hypothetical protein
MLVTLADLLMSNLEARTGVEIQSQIRDEANMAESDEAYAKLTEISARVESLERTVSSLADTESSRKDVIEHLLRSNETPGRVLLCVAAEKKQAAIKAAYEARWGSVSVGTISMKLGELRDLGYILRSPSRGPDGFEYLLTTRITHRLIKELERRVK